MADTKTNEWRTKLAKLAANKRARTILIVVGLGLMVILFLSGLQDKTSKSKPQQERATVQEVTVADYAAQLEDNLEEMLRQIKSVGEVKVLVTIEKGVENVYATEEKTSKQVTNDRNSDVNTKNQEHDNTETTYILVKDSDGSQRAVPVTQLQPVVKGVVVVCEGGGIPAVEQQVTNAVATALNLSTARVCVVNSK